MRERSLTYIHFGKFSGSATSLAGALAASVQLIDYDLMSLARHHRLWTSRLRGMLEAREGGKRTPWTKTAVWSQGTQRLLEASGLLGGGPMLFVQTLAAFMLPPTTRYAIYTDRVASEGAAVAGGTRSRFTSKWFEREQAFLRGAHRIFTMGPSSQDVLETEYGVDPSKVVVAGAGPNMRLGSQIQSESCHRLLFVGTQWELKGGPELLTAFSKVREQHPSLELVLVGGGPGGRLPEGVTSLGYVPPDEMDRVYSAADALVIPTHMEAFGIALIEGLIKGLPCIGTTIGNQPWIVGNGGECIVPGDVGVLSAAISRLVTDYSVHAQRARTRGRLLKNQMTWAHVAELIVNDLVAEAA